MCSVVASQTSDCAARGQACFSCARSRCYAIHMRHLDRDYGGGSHEGHTSHLITTLPELMGYFSYLP